MTAQRTAGLARIVATQFVVAREGTVDDFAEYVFATRTSPLSPNEVEEYLKGEFGIEVADALPSRAGAARFNVEDPVVINVEKHKAKDYPITDYPEYQTHNGKEGTVVDVSGQDVMVEFDDGNKVLFHGGMKANSGLTKPTKSYEAPPHGPIEIIYTKNPANKPSRMEVVQEYLDKKPGQRSPNYYSGNFYGPRRTQSGNKWTLNVRTQQRADGPGGEFGFAAMDPFDGAIWYIGRPNKRPVGWFNKLKQIVDDTQKTASIKTAGNIPSNFASSISNGLKSLGLFANGMDAKIVHARGFELETPSVLASVINKLSISFNGVQFEGGMSEQVVVNMLHDTETGPVTYKIPVGKFVLDSNTNQTTFVPVSGKTKVIE